MVLQEMNLLEETINEAVKENLKTTSDNVKISDKDTNTTTTTTTTELATDASSIVICVEDTVSPSSDFNQHLIRSRYEHSGI